MPQCVAFGCTNRNEKKSDSITFHRFPKDVDLRLQWIHAIRRKNWKPSSTCYVCSIHFKDEDLDRTSPFRTYIKKGAIPTIFPGFPQRLQNQLKKKEIGEKKSGTVDSSLNNEIEGQNQIKRKVKSNFPTGSRKQDINSENKMIKEHLVRLRCTADSEDKSEYIVEIIPLSCGVKKKIEGAKMDMVNKDNLAVKVKYEVEILEDM